MTNVYKDSGVDIEAGDAFSATAAQLSAETWRNSPYVQVEDWSSGSFRGPFVYDFVNLPPGCKRMPAADGIGTKQVLTTAAMTHRLSARDLVAMSAEDITRKGGLPQVFTNLLDVSSIGEIGSPTFNCFVSLIEGLRDVANSQGFVLIGGETAELGICVGSDIPDAITKYNWAGFMTGVTHRDVLITGEHMQVGDAIVGVRDCGLRSNGFSLVRKKAFPIRFGPEWWNNPNPAAKRAIRAAAEPSVLCSRFLAECNGWFSRDFVGRIPIAGIAHITGGGIAGKFGKDLLFKWGLSAELTDLFSPPTIMQECVEAAEVSDRECYEKLHGGQALLLVMKQQYVRDFIARAYNAGLRAQNCGKVIASGGEPSLVIDSKFRGEKLTYP